MEKYVHISRKSSKFSKKRLKFQKKFYMLKKVQNSQKKFKISKKVLYAQKSSKFQKKSHSIQHLLVYISWVRVILFFDSFSFCFFSGSEN